VVTAGHVTDLGVITLATVAPQVVAPAPMARPAPVGLSPPARARR
jgi:hypothetical protein